MKPGLVTVVIPVYNGARYVRQAIDSVLAQTCPDIEIIIVDDGSTDDSAAILGEYGDAIQVIRQENCGNVGQVRNTGIENARGEFIAFLDQDDWWLPEKIERQMEVMRSDPRIGLVHTAVEHFDDSTGQAVGPLNPQARPERMVGECFEALLMGNSLCNSSVLVRRAVLTDVGLCNTNIPGNTIQDYDLWLRVAERFRFGFVAEEHTIYRLHAGQGMLDRRAMLSEVLGLLLRMRDQRSWNRSRAGRQRLAGIYDELAVAHYDCGAISEARRWFARSSWLSPSGRSISRLLGSWLPHTIVEKVRN